MSRAHSPGDDAASPGFDIDPPQASALLAALSGFLTAAVHCILHGRALYPSATFISTRAYNFPVHQSRHPGVCAWVKDAVAAAEAQIRNGAAQNVVLVIHSDNAVLERWVFDVSSLPGSWGTAKSDDADVNWADVHQGFRGALSRLAAVGGRLDPLPGGCSFSLAVELRDGAQPPIQHPQVWIPSDGGHPSSSSVGGTRGTTIPIRAVRAGVLFLECRVENLRDSPDA